MCAKVKKEIHTEVWGRQNSTKSGGIFYREAGSRRLETINEYMVMSGTQ